MKVEFLLIQTTMKQNVALLFDSIFVKGRNVSLILMINFYNAQKQKW